MAQIALFWGLFGVSGPGFGPIWTQIWATQDVMAGVCWTRRHPEMTRFGSYLDPSGTTPPGISALEARIYGIGSLDSG